MPQAGRPRCIAGLRPSKALLLFSHARRVKLVTASLYGANRYKALPYQPFSRSPTGGHT